MIACPPMILWHPCRLITGYLGQTINLSGEIWNLQSQKRRTPFFVFFRVGLLYAENITACHYLYRGCGNRFSLNHRYNSLFRPSWLYTSVADAPWAVQTNTRIYYASELSILPDGNPEIKGYWELDNGAYHYSDGMLPFPKLHLEKLML